MTWARRLRIALYTLGLAWLGWYGAWAVAAGLWLMAAVLYLAASALALLAFLEWAAAEEYADDVDACWPTRPTSRAQARLGARRVLRHACRCDRWWTSFGTDHDPWCPVQTGAAHRARLPHPRRRPLPRRRAVAPARRHRRHRPR
ncbi:hypothetical protein ABTY98_05130 [Streptomyces sp. NPDC096040]|uniref:hypothetical protein n=1 Tax=Streptomyces sp. NPDC096040 TaxID=3155541 RepID=UPI003316D9F6